MYLLIIGCEYINIKYPKITVVTPSFNQGKYLEKTIHSIIDQNYPNLEYIIIDGGSTDNSIEIIKKFEKHLSYWVSEPDKGQYNAINKGFQRSTGEIMTWINSDDIFLPWTLKTISEIFMTLTEVEWVTGFPAYIYGSESYIEISCIRPFSQELIQKGFYEGRKIHFIQQEGTFWRKNLWMKSGGYIDDNLKLAGDFDLWYRFSKYSPVFLLGSILACFRVHNEQKTSSQMSKYYLEVDNIVKFKTKIKILKKLQSMTSLFPLLRSVLMDKYKINSIKYDHINKKWTTKISYEYIYLR